MRRDRGDPSACGTTLAELAAGEPTDHRGPAAAAGRAGPRTVAGSGTWRRSWPPAAPGWACRWTSRMRPSRWKTQPRPGEFHAAEHGGRAAARRDAGGRSADGDPRTGWEAIFSIGPISRASSTPTVALHGRPRRGPRTVAAAREPRAGHGPAGRGSPACGAASISTGPPAGPLDGGRGGDLHLSGTARGRTFRTCLAAAGSQRHLGGLHRRSPGILLPAARGAFRLDAPAGLRPPGGLGCDADFDGCLRSGAAAGGRHWEPFLPASLASQWSKLLPAGEVDLRGPAVRPAGQDLAPTSRSGAATSRSPTTGFPTASIGLSAPSPTRMARWRCT